MTTRRQFVLTAVPATALLLGARGASAQPAKLEESDPAAVALGYKMDATKVDAKKFPTYKAGNVCSNCQLYSGKANDATGPCAAFGGKLVSAKGWCSAWAKKA
jgi:High potential iron-sulfur protein